MVSDGGDEDEILVVQAKVGNQEIRIINAYGPQEDEQQNSLSFWQNIEAEVISAADENCSIIIQLDANAKVGSPVIVSDPNEQSNNGKLLMEMIKRQNLFLLNATDLCKGKITRHRTTKNGEEKSILNYIIVCETLFLKLVKMLIDDERIHTLTKYVSTRGRVQKSESDHNLLFCQFDLSYRSKNSKEDRRTIFNFKNAESQEMFHEITSKSDIFVDIVESKNCVEEKSNLFVQSLNRIFSQTFKKIRVNKAIKRSNSTEEYMKVKSKLKILLRNSPNNEIKIFISRKIETVEEIISLDCSEENVKKVNDYIGSLEAENGCFSQCGMWQLKSKLCPRPLDPPTAKLDKNGKLVTNPQKLLDLYLETYSDRLRHREMKKEYADVFHLKNNLWKLRLEKCLQVKTEAWTEKNLKIVLNKFKKNKTRDPLGMVNETFKPGVIGGKLERAILSLLNSIKSESVVPTILRLANISSIWKRKNSKLSLESDRRIFVLCVLRHMLDKLVYNDLYPEIEANMSNSNIGAMKNKNIRNHLFVVYGKINSVVRGESPCVDIQIFDLIKCFDVLWLEDVMNDLYDSVPHSGQNDKLAFL